MNPAKFIILGLTLPLAGYGLTSLIKAIFLPASIQGFKMFIKEKGLTLASILVFVGGAVWFYIYLFTVRF